MQTVDQVNDLLIDALNQNASDLHFDPFPTGCRLRMRVDGLLLHHSTLPPSQYAAVLSRIKTLSGLDIAQQRLPQDGRLSFCHDHHQAQFRVHTCSSLHGEKMVLRLIHAATECLPLERLGLWPCQLKLLSSVLQLNHGLIIVCGPTGSGKTMTLYAMLTELMRRSLQIITLEDPVEMALEGLSQLQVQRKQQLDFATLLRASLRQDPDVIMIGEIRDEETAQIAVRAALTGHLVLTSLHTPTSQASLARLRNMGIPSYDLNECLQAVIAQRLVRLKAGKEFLGRRGIFEIYQPGKTHLTLAQAGALLVEQQLTSPTEIERVL